MIVKQLTLGFGMARFVGTHYTRSVEGKPLRVAVVLTDETTGGQLTLFIQQPAAREMAEAIIALPHRN